jgi:hypothetical protein
MGTRGLTRARGKRRSFCALAGVLAVALLAAGCGGGSGDTSSAAAIEASGGHLTKAELVKQGNAICAKVFAQAAQFDPEGTKKEAVQVAGLYRGMTKHLLALGAPQETEYDYAEYINGVNALAEAAGEVESAAKKDDGAALAKAESSALSMSALFQTEAGIYGLTVCGEGPN